MDANSMEHSWVCYRLPNADEYIKVSQDGAPEVCKQLNDLTGKEGFVVAPFQLAVDTPLLLIKAQKVEHCPLYPIEEANDEYSFVTDEDERRKNYEKSFELCEQALKNGTVGKIVLSRRLELTNSGDTLWTPVSLFQKACALYPNHYVAMWDTPQTGCWLVATPETLLERCASHWRTMALAGTMTWEAGKTEGRSAHWSGKDKKEQQVVADYVKECISPLSEYIEVRGPYPSRAADLAHLRTDFIFVPRQDVGVGDLLQALHPTPAVGGLPVEKSIQLINQCEDSPREYYAGFSGPLDINEDACFYVTLRCMKLSSRKALLYAGGGLMRSSSKGTEWMETKRKLKTMLNLFSVPREEKEEEEHE